MSVDYNGDSLNQGDINEAARYADLMRIHGQSLQDYVASDSADQTLPAAGDGKEDILKFYEENPNRQIDLDSPDAEKHWREITDAFSERHTDYMKLFGDTASEIAALPLHLAEGMIEQPNPLVWAGSTIEGTGRALRDMWGLAFQSENPTSPLFRFKSAINALVHGKPSANWRDEAQQWNDARRFLWHSAKIQNGDEVLLDQVSSLSDRDRETIKSFVNPKIAHAMGYIGLEVPAIASAAFSAGAGTGAAIEAATAISTAGRRAAQAQKVGLSLHNLANKFENYASKVSNKLVEKTAGGIGNLLEKPATMAGNLIGGTAESIAGRVGRTSAEVRNVVESAALDLSREVGAGEVQATVGILGSLGLRTFSEVAKEIGHQAALRSAGVVESSSTTGLTLLEKTALAPLSRSGQNAAKFLSYTVDPVIQLSTSALKSSYKGAFEFGLLGYLNDKDKGAVSGAAMGMVWSGYSGAVRHIWSSVSGANSHAQIIKDFDERALPHYEKTNSKFATVARTLIADADKAGSTRISANIRKVIQMAADSCKTDLKDFIIHLGDESGLAMELLSNGIPYNESFKIAVASSGGRAAFSYAYDFMNQKRRPILFINDKNNVGHRSTDVAHDVMGHMLNHSLLVNGHIGEFFYNFFGTKKDGGVAPDQAYIDHAALVAATQVALHTIDDISKSFEAENGRPIRKDDLKSDPEGRDYINRKTKEYYNDLQEHFTDVMNEIRSGFDSMDRFMTYVEKTENGITSHEPMLYENVRGLVRRDSNNKAINKRLQWLDDLAVKDGIVFGSKFLFEEILASRSEHLFMHTNLSSITTPDALMPVRLMLESKRDSMLASNLTQMELAGIKVQNAEFFDVNGSPVQQTMVYDNGKFLRWPEMDGFIKSYIRKAIGHDIVPVSRMSPERQAVEAKRFGKEYLFNAARAGMTMKGTKEINEILSERTKAGFEVLSNLDESIRPEVITDENGNARIDMSRMNPAAWDALRKAGALDDTAHNYGKIIADVMRQWELNGFSTPNIMTGVYWGDSHEIIRNGILERLRGNDVPITHRVFVPFEMNMTMRISDANGRRLKNPKYGITITAIDYLAIHRRKIKAWSRGDIQSLFAGIDHMNRSFDAYLINMMQEPSKRVPSEQLFFSEFGDRAAAVRDACHEIFGAVLRKDESYINTPIDGHENKRGPNFPINSFKLELMVDLGRSPSTPFPYHHGRSYDGLRRNLSTAGFERVGKAERYVNSNGYEIIKSGAKYKVFSPFGKLMDVVDSIAKGSRIADKDIRKLDPADVMPFPTEASVSQVNPLSDMSPSYRDVNGAQLSGFSSDGTMKSIIGISKDSRRVIRFDEEFVDWKSFSRKVGANMSKVDSSDQRATLRDLLTPSSQQQLDRFMKESGYKYDIGKIRILPKIPMDSARFAGVGIGVSFAETGRYFEITPEEHGGGIAIFLDMDYLNGLSSEKEKMAKVNAAIKSSTLALTRHFSGDSIYGAGPFIASTEKSMKFDPKLDLAVANGYANAIANRSLIDASQSSARSSYHNSVQWMDEINFVQLISDLKDGKFSPIKGVGSTDFGTFQATISAFAKNSKYKTDLKEVGEGLQIVSEIALTAKESDFGTTVGDGGNLVSFPSYVDKDGKMGNAFLRLESWMGRNAGKDEIVSFVNEVAGRFMLHSLFQIGSESSHFIDPSNARTYAREQNVLGGSGSSSLIHSARYFAESINSSQKNPVYVFIRNKQGSATLSELGHVIVVENGKNEFAGSKFSTENVPEIAQQRAGFNRVFSRDGFPVPEHLDAVLADLFNNAHISDIFVQRMNHLHVVASEILHVNRGLEGQVMSLFQKFDSDSDRIALANGLIDLASSNEIESAIIPAHSALAIEMAMDKNSLDKRFNQLSTYSGNEKAYADRAMREAKSHWNQAMRHYWTIKDGDLKSESTKLHGALDNLYGMKFFKDNMSQADIQRIRDHAKKQSLINAGIFDNVMGGLTQSDKASKILNTKSMLSIAGVDSLRDRSRIRDLIDLGLVKVIYDRSGNPIHTFEFSDAQAGLNVDKNRNKTYLTPFVSEKNPEFAFEKYRQKVEASDRITNETVSESTLGEVFSHDTLYFYYPELKSMKVEFFDGFGGQYASPEHSLGERIRIGARQFCGPELSRGIHGKEMGHYLRSRDSLAEKFASKNPVASIILHEVQHALQFRSNTFERTIPLTYPSKRVMTGYFANLMGVTGNIQMKDINMLKMEQMFGKDPVIKAIGMDDSFVDAKSYYDSLSPDEATVIKVIDSLGDSPVFLSLQHSAHPLLHSSLSQLAGYVAEYHDRGVVPLRFAEKVMELYERSKESLSNEEVFKLSVEVEDLHRIAMKHPEYGIHMVGDTTYKTSMAAISVYSSILTAKDIPSTSAGPRVITEKMTMLRHALNNFVNANYMMDVNELMARETQRRAGMTDTELSRNPRTEFGNFQFGSSLDIIERAFESSTILKPSELTKAVKANYDNPNSGKVGIVMKSIAGIGATSKDNPVLQALVGAMMVHYVGSSAYRELQQLGRASIGQKGWEVGEDGKVRFVDRMFMLKGSYDNIKAGLGLNERVTGENIEFSGYDASKPRTMSIEDICRTADCVIEAEEGISVGSPVLDAVLSSNFPEVIKGSEIIKKLAENGIEEGTDAMSMVDIKSIADAFEDVELTKRDLSNLIILRHRIVEGSSVQFGEHGTVPSQMNIDIKNVGKEQAIKGLSSSELGREMVRKALGSTGYVGQWKSMSVGRYVFEKGVLSFVPNRPAWADPLQFDEAAKRHINSVFHENLRKNFGLGVDLGRVADALNDRLIKKAVLLEPVMSKAMEWALEEKNNKKYPELIASLLDDAFRSSMEVSANAAYHGISFLNEAEGFLSNDAGITMTKAQKETGLSRARVEKLERGLGQSSDKHKLYERNKRRPLFVGTAWHGIAANLADATSVYTGTVFTGEATPNFGSSYSYARYNEKSTSLDMARAQANALPNSEEPFALAQTAPDVALSSILYSSYSSSSQMSFHHYRNALTDANQVYQSSISDVQHAIHQLESKMGAARALGDHGVADAIQEKISRAQDRLTGLNRESQISIGLAKMYESLNALDESYSPKNASTYHRHRIGLLTGQGLRNVVPSTLAQAFKVGDRVYVSPEYVLPDSETTNQISVQLGGNSGVSPDIRLAATQHMMYSDIVYPLLMNMEHTRYESEDVPRIYTTPYDRYSVLINHLKKIHDDSGSGVLFSVPASANFPYLQAVMGGGGIVESGLFTHAVKHGSNHAWGVRDVINSIGAEEMNRVFGSPESQVGKSVLDVPSKFVKGDEKGVFISPSVFGVMASPLVRLILSRGLMEPKNGIIKFGVPNEFSSVKHDAVMEMANRGEYAKPLSQVSGEALSTLKEFFDSLSDSTKDRVALELSSTNNIHSVTTAIGASMAYQLAELQEADPANFPHTIKKMFLPNQSGDGLSLRKAIDWCIQNNEHNRHNGTTAAPDWEKFGCPPSHAKIFASNMPSVVNSLDFWHAYFSSLTEHKKIEVPKLDSEAEKLGPDYVFRGSGLKSLNEEHTMLRDGFCMIKGYITLNSERFTEDVHAFHQGIPYIHTPIGLGDLNSITGESGSGRVRSGLDSYNPTSDSRRRHFRLPSRPHSLDEAIVHHKDMVVPQILRDIPATDVSSEPTKGGASRISLPVIKDSVSKTVRGKFIRQQLAMAAKSLGSDKVSAQAARFPISGRIPTAYMSMTSSERYESASRLTNNAMKGRGGDFNLAIGSNDMPRAGFSWKRLSDGRIMVNYAPDIDAPMLSEMSENIRNKVKLGIPFRKVLGFDASSGNIIPQSYFRTAQLNAKLHESKNMRSLPAAMALSSMLHFDREVMAHYGKAIRMLSKDLGITDLIAKDFTRINDENSITHGVDAFLEEGRNVEAGNLWIPEIDSNSRPSVQSENDFRLITDLDQIQHSSNPENSYLTFILPADSKPEHFQSAIAAIHMANSVYGGNGLIGGKNAVLSNGIVFGNSGYTSYYMDFVKHLMRDRNVGEETAGIQQSIGFRQGDSSTSTNSSKTAMEGLRGFSIHNPFGIHDINDASSRVFGSDAGYFIPEAERKLKLHGDREEIIKLMFPNRPDLLRYSWDRKSGGANVSIVKRSGNAGYFVSHDVITGIDSNGNPKTSRKTMPFRTESEANQYASGLGTFSTEAHIPSEMFGEKGKYTVESLGQTNMVDAELSYVRSLNFKKGEESISQNRNLVRVGDIETPMPLAQAKAVSKMLLSHDVVSGEAPKSGPIMLSTRGISGEGLRPDQIERLVRNNISFGTAGSLYRFSSKALRALAYGNDRYKNFKQTMTGHQMFDLMSFHGVSKHEMRVTGLADMLYRNKDASISRQEVAEYLAATYPMFGRHIMGRKMPTSGSHFPVMTSGEWSNMQNTKRYLSRISEVENRINLAMESAEGEAGKAQMGSVRELIRKTFKDAIAEVFGKEAADEIPSSENVSDVITKSLASDSSPDLKLKINPSTLEVFRRTMIDRLSDKSIEEACAAHGIDVGNLREGFLDEKPMDGMTTSEQVAFSNGNYDTSGTAFVGSGNWSQYSSGLGPYWVHLLHGHASDQTRLTQITKYIESVSRRLEATEDPKEKAKLQSIIKSAKNVHEVRKQLFGLMRNSGHWNSPSGTMQYSHLRTSEGASMVSSHIGAGIEEIAAKIAEGSDAMPINFIEELQSDTYQRSTFGVTSMNVALAGDFKEAEGALHASRISELAKLIETEGRRLDQVGSTFTKMNKNQRGVPTAVMSNLAQWRFENASRIVQHLIIQKVKSNLEGNFAEELQNKVFSAIVEDNSNPVKISKEMQDKYGLPPTIPTYSFDSSNPYYRPLMRTIGIEITQGSTGSGGVIDSDTIRKMYGDQNPNSPVNTQRLTNHSSDPYTLMMQILHNEILRDEDYAANLAFMKDSLDSNQKYEFQYDYDSLAKRCSEALRRRIDLTKDLSGTERLHLAYLAEDIAKLSSLSGRSYADGIRVPSSPHEILRGNRPDEAPRNYEQRLAFVNSVDWSKKRLYVLNNDVVRYSKLEKTHGSSSFPNEFRSNVPLHLDNYHMLEMTPAEMVRNEFNMRIAAGGNFEATMHNLFGLTMEKNEQAYELAKQLVEGKDRSTDAEKIKKLYLIGIGENFESRNFYTLDGDYDASTFDHRYLGTVDCPESRRFYATTMAGRLAEKLSQSCVESHSSLSSKERIDVLQKEKAELEKKAGFTIGEYSFPNTIPLGEDNAYRSMSINFLVMQALQEGKNALAWADGRHHRSRYSSTSYTTQYVINKNSATGKSYISRIPSVSSFPAAYGINVSHGKNAHGGLFEAIRNGTINLDDRSPFEWNGKNGTLKEHIVQAVNESFSDSFQSETIATAIRKMGEAIHDHILNAWSNKTEVTGPQDIERFIGKSSFSDSSQDIIRKLTAAFESNAYAVSIPYDKTHGYAVNYGIPQWMAEIQYSGQPAKSALSVSHDAFSVPSVRLEANGTYTIFDSTGKTLAEGIESKEMMEERRAQLSKYLGNVPFITNFVKQYGPAGGHVKRGFLWSNRVKSQSEYGFGNSTPELANATANADLVSGGFAMKPDASYDSDPTQVQQKQIGNRVLRDDSTGNKQFNDDQSLTDVRGPVYDGIGLYSELGQMDNPNSIHMAMAMYAMGLRSNHNAQEAAAAIRNASGFNSPLLIIKPKYPTQQHAAAMRDLIVKGIPLLSTAGIGKGILISRAKRMFHNFMVNPNRINSAKQKEMRFLAMGPIKDDYINSELTVDEIAKKHGTTAGQINYISKSMNWGNRKTYWSRGRLKRRE